MGDIEQCKWRKQKISRERAEKKLHDLKIITLRLLFSYENLKTDTLVTFYIFLIPLEQKMYKNFPNICLKSILQNFIQIF